MTIIVDNSFVAQSPGIIIPLLASMMSSVKKAFASPCCANIPAEPLDNAVLKC